MVWFFNAEYLCVHFFRTFLLSSPLPLHPPLFRYFLSHYIYGNTYLSSYCISYRESTPRQLYSDSIKWKRTQHNVFFLGDQLGRRCFEPSAELFLRVPVRSYIGLEFYEVYLLIYLLTPLFFKWKVAIATVYDLADQIILININVS